MKRISDSLFHGQVKTAHFVEDEHELGKTLASCARPDLVTEPAVRNVGFIHRHLDVGDLYFVANTSNKAQTFRAALRETAKYAEEWDGFTGTRVGLPDPKKVELRLEPYESRLLFFSNLALAPPTKATDHGQKQVDISRDWKVDFGSLTVQMPNLVSWTDDTKLRYYTGTASYEKSVEVSRSTLQRRGSIFLDFGQGKPVVVPDPLPNANMRAYLESPVEVAAVVYVNDRLAGYVWHPPYRVEISSLLEPGTNKIRVVVGNTAINQMAGVALPDYRLLYSRFGVEFIPQGMEDLKPLPSGILGPVSLIENQP